MRSPPTTRRPWSAVALSTLTYLAGALAYVGLPVVLALVALGPGRNGARDMIWPATPDRRLAAVAFWAPLLVPVAVALAAQFPLTSLWTMSAWTLLPVVLLSSPLTALNHQLAVRIVVLAALVPFVMIAAAPAVAYAVHRAGVVPAAAYSSLLAKRVEAVWKQTTDRPLRLFAGWEDLGYGVGFYLPGRPLVVNAIDGVPPPDLDQRIARNGIAMICPAQAPACINAAMRRASRSATGMRIEVEVTRPYFGIVGQTGALRDYHDGAAGMTASVRVSAPERPPQGPASGYAPAIRICAVIDASNADDDRSKRSSSCCFSRSGRNE